ncbi:MFS general substrate transporter [Aspergillus avenaceus]|uniref:MFS general substrate transporter n=1 Tax=Aspergillus avenaceus TaxID=36643 RepID=A0A5N6TLK9_ASPAV|nr:MFS general substrate transporter [Aspergillus avenaceus]
MKEETMTMDHAASYLAHTVEHPPVTREMEKKLVRKLDWILLPMLFLTATLGAVDKVAISTAAIYGLKEDLHLAGQQFSWAGSILSIGSIVGMWPSSYLVQRLPSAKYLSACAFGWSSMALLMAACRNWSGLMALRFFMGTLEAIIVPCVTLIVAGFYKRDEQPPRNAVVLAAVSSVINGFLSWAVGHIPQPSPLAIWQYLYLIVGTVSITWSIIAFAFLPDSPMNACFLTDQEKFYAIQRVAENRTGIVNKQWKWEQAWEAILDPKTWILFLFNIAINIPNGGLLTFSGIIINGLGFSSVHTSLLNMPTGVMSTISAFGFSWLAARWHNRRCLVAMIAACLPIIGSIVVYTLPRTNVGGQMVGIYFVWISLAQANTAGHTKKNVQYSILYIGYAVGNLIGPQTFRANQAPAYTGGFIAMLASYCACLLLMTIYWILVVRMNRRLNGINPEVDVEPTTKHVQCTEETPRCRRCERLDRKCERGLRLTFREDAIQRGISFGRKGAQDVSFNLKGQFCAVPLDQYIGRWIFLITTTSDLDRSQDDNGAVDSQWQYTSSSSRLASVEEHQLPLLSRCFGHPLMGYPETERYLLEYFIHEIGPNCSLSAVENPYISLITPLCFTSASLRHSILAVASNQLLLLNDMCFERETLVFKSMALRGLHQDITSGAIRDDIIATVLMLCFHDISDECDAAWITHLQAGLELIRQSLSRSSERSALRKFCAMYFYAHDILNRTASPKAKPHRGRHRWLDGDDLNEVTSFYFLSTLRYLQYTDLADQIDMTMGCSRRLLSLIDDTTQLTTRIIEIEWSLHGLAQNVPAHSVARQDLALIAEVKRLAALLYLSERRSLLILSEQTRRHLVFSIIRIISELPDSATLLWPLYVLGHVGLEDEEQRRFILDRLERIEKTRNLGSIKRASIAVKRAFQLDDFNYPCGRESESLIASISLA